MRLGVHLPEEPVAKVGRTSACCRRRRALGVQHLLVDPPAGTDPRALGEEVPALRRAIGR